MAEAPVTIKVRGQRVAAFRDVSSQPVLPRFLASGTRAADVSGDPFLPKDYVRVVEAIDLSTTARATEAVAPTEVPSQPSRVIVLELEDGTTVVTSPENLRRTLERVHPESVEADGHIDLDGLEKRGKQTRDVLGAGTRIIRRFFALDLGGGPDAILDAARGKLAEWLRERAQEVLGRNLELGVSWLGTKALMWAIESRLGRKPGLYRWSPSFDDAAVPLQEGDASLGADAAKGPLLVFIHGTGSNTEGSFGDLRSSDRETWRQLEERFGTRIFAFEHRTLSESPIENALALARVLPAGAQVNLVTHSRGGLVGDLLCLARLADSDAKLIDEYALDDKSPLGAADETERDALKAELTRVYAEQRAQLRDLGAMLAQRKLRIDRYVRVAAPARGTRLASSNFDAFLSALLTLIGLVPALAGQPLYSAFRRAVLEIVKNRTKPQLVPGIEAMLPESPIARLLARAEAPKELPLAVIAGDVDGGGLLQRLGVLFTDHAFFDGVDNDLVVDTDSMYAGIARPGETHTLFEKGAQVNHFTYFRNDDSRRALRDWLVTSSLEAVDGFALLPGMTPKSEPTGADQATRDRARARTRGLDRKSLPTVVVLPGIMGSHLWVGRKDRVWLDVGGLLLGDLEKIEFGKPDIEAEALFSQYYGDLCDDLASTHRVVRFPYDWRLPLDVLGRAFAKQIKTLLADPDRGGAPIRLLAHSMGGLVVRSMIHLEPELWEELMKPADARFVMLGTPNRGSHSMVETLIGKANAIRMLARGDIKHDLQELLNFVGGFRGALQLLPSPSLQDRLEDDQPLSRDYFAPDTWEGFRTSVKDFWFGDGRVAVPKKKALDEGRWLWDRDAERAGVEIPTHQEKVHYVCGVARNTAVGVQRKGDGPWKMVGTPEGDGTVTWESGLLGCIPSRNVHYMRAEHGALASTSRYFASLAQLLERGQRGDLEGAQPRTRAVEAAAERAGETTYDAGPPVLPTPTDLAGALLGRHGEVEGRVRSIPTLTVQVRAMDLRWSAKPILVGHYEQDAIAGAEAIIDRELLDHQLTVRHNLGLYAGPVGTATVALTATNEEERRRGSLRGAVVTGLGPYDGLLGVATLTEAVKTAGIRYLLHVDDSTSAGATLGGEDLPLATLLIGYNSSANLRIGDSITAILRGILNANRKFEEATEKKLRIARLDIVELYLDTAITASRELRRVADALNRRPGFNCRIEVLDLLRGEGAQPRLEDASVGDSYWPRLIVTDADRAQDECPPECYEPRCPPECFDEPCDCPDEEGDEKSGAGPSRPDRRPKWLRQRTALAERLKFLFVGARARIESIQQQRQPGLVETLVQKQIGSPLYNADFGRTLFSLLVPQDFKDTARQTERVVLALDGYTANLPWELMLADDGEPLAVKTAMVRQLVSPRFRKAVRQTVARRAYVVGNPSYEGFAKAFGVKQEPSSLAGAEEEALRVVQVLARHDIDVPQASIGQDQQALDVINRLYQHPYRILHIAAHGVFGQRRADGSVRTGVVLSDGLLITAAEIEAMEFVPDLVFLNCCHLGKMDRVPSLEKLAYSISRELIEMGVRAVVAGGWAVEDGAGQHFAETFYDELLGSRKSFGEAVHAARRSTYESYRSSNTWGAYQAWGDPGWRFSPKQSFSGYSSDDWLPEAPEEIEERIERVRIEAAMLNGRPSPTDIDRWTRKVTNLVAKARPSWMAGRAEIEIALGKFYAELGPDHFEEACRHYELALSSEDTLNRATLYAIEQLSNLEARRGEKERNAEPVERAIARLKRLCDLPPGDTPPEGQSFPLLNGERTSLLGSAYKRLASVHARAVLGGELSAGSDMERALTWSKFFYGPLGEGGAVKSYAGLNWLSLEALDPEDEPKEAQKKIDLARLSANEARAEFAKGGTYWEAVGPADALLVEWILSGKLAGENATAALDELERIYQGVFATVAVKPQQRDSTLQHILMLAVILRAKAKLSSAAPSSALVADRLCELLRRLDASLCDEVACPVPDANPPAAPAPRPRGSGAKAAGRKRPTRKSRR